MPDLVRLPPPRRRGMLSVAEALAGRRSVRFLAPAPLTAEEIGELLWAAQGVTSAESTVAAASADGRRPHPAGRTAPSAGALYPLEVYAATQDGLFRYRPSEHALEPHRDADIREDLYAAALMMETVRRAPLTIIVAAVYARTAARYGRDRAPRYVHLEAGHAAQNILLTALSLGLGAVPLGAFFDDEVREVVALPEDEAPLYLVSVGHPS
jgi:SagB-type dehydrogenase family enzyme